jgi:hypothetical protein
MALSIDINLPRSHRARFPDRCVVCGLDEPGSTVRLFSTSIGWWTWVFLVGGWPSVVDAPACRSCGWQYQFTRGLGFVVSAAVTWIVLSLTWPLISNAVPRGLRKWVVAAIVLLCLSPLIIYRIFRPKAFDITVYAKSIDYEFADQQYAIDFAVLNCGAEWVKVNGSDITKD